MSDTSKPGAGDLGALLSVADQLQALALSGKTVSIAVTAGDRTGRIDVRNGEIVDAIFEGREGPEAAIQLINLPDAHASIIPSGKADRRTIQMGFFQLLCEAARYKDEETARVSELKSHNRKPPSMRLMIGRGSDSIMFAISGKFLRVGRGLDNDVVIPDSSVSRHHAEIEIQDHSVVLRDLNSSNGTYVDGARVKEALLRARERILFGSVHAEFRSEPAGAQG